MGSYVLKLENELETESKRQPGSPSSLPLWAWVGYHHNVLTVCVALSSPPLL